MAASGASIEAACLVGHWINKKIIQNA